MRNALILMVGLLWPCYTIAQTTQSSFLRIYTEEYAPWNFTREDEVTGLNTELIQQLLDKLSLRGRFEIVPWGRAQLFTQTQADSCFFSAVRSAEREKLYQWVGPLSREYVQLFSTDPAHPKFNQFADAAELLIGGQTADAYTDYGMEQGLKIERIAEIPVNLAMLQLKRIDLWLAGSVGGPYIAAQKGIRIYPVASSADVFELWMACNLQVPEAVIDNLNRTLQLSKQDGTLDAIMQRYQE
ncbi:ABC transporter substrate-binding protein [Arsukibacterium ikkense]|uniref:ABC transporter substrate-binding protein n=1 Tax=Arsukibacterium ikkense TaxID=336831 RepID=A0A0M2V4T8_9GAMM|nr:transporter substrate-binding domain-containing protein [Arsukibacterium ikkense]KKO45424.1 ABC transporter substrate-binding protein [Arsukibacterium ikkense]